MVCDETAQTVKVRLHTRAMQRKAAIVSRVDVLVADMAVVDVVQDVGLVLLLVVFQVVGDKLAGKEDERVCVFVCFFLKNLSFLMKHHNI